MLGAGAFRSIVWCERCGAIGFRDAIAGHGITEEWRRPTSRARRGARPSEQ
jgi:hypothetical protein